MVSGANYKMTLEERKKQYRELKEIWSQLPVLQAEKEAAFRAGNAAFDELEKIDSERASEEANQAGWFAVDDLDDEIFLLKQREKDLYSALEKYNFLFDEYESIGAYRINLKRKVKVIFLDGREERGLIYAWVYDNPYDYYLKSEKDGSRIDLGKGWEIMEIVVEETNG